MQRCGAASLQCRWIDADGEPVTMVEAAAVSMIAREGRPIAGVIHEPGALDPTTLERELGAAAQMAVDNERLRAQARAHLRELKESRARIVEASDRERRRLERDLHDGAQQRLVGLSVAMAMTRAFAADADATATLARPATCSSTRSCGS